MSIVNAPLRVLFDLLLAPFSDLPAWVGVTLVSLVTGIAVLIVFKHTSNQKALDAVKRKIHGGLFEIRLFNDDLRIIMKALGGILWHNLSYLKHSSIPLIWTLPPLVLVIAQLQFHYGYSGLEVGKPALVKVQFTDAESAGAGPKPSVLLEAPEGIRVEEPSLWAPSLAEMTWRIVPEASGDYELTVKSSSETLTKSLTVADNVVRRSPIRLRGFFDELLYPAEAPVPEGPIESVSVSYPEIEIDFFGIGLHWLIWYFILATLFAFALRGPLKVTI